MKTFDVLMCQRDDLEASDSFLDLLELDNLKSIEVQADSSLEAKNEALRLHGEEDWMVIRCDEQQRVEGYQGFTVTN